MSEAHLLVKSHNLELKQNLADAIADNYRNDSAVDDNFKNADLKIAPWISEQS